jgi:glycosyltransferase involved in cell wall biosynthesis
MTQPLVSIVTPSFNQGRFIAETIRSVLSQDYPRIEYLVVDGGSSDGTLEILHQFGDRLRWTSEPDRGQSDAINKGWRATSGEIVAWLNSDDVYHPGAITKVAGFFQTHPDVDLVYGDCDHINDQGGITRRNRSRQATAADLLRSPSSIIAQPAAFVRRRALMSVGYLDETLHYVMDLEMFLRVASRHKIAYLPERLASFRLHPQSKSSSQSAGLEQERVQMLERFFESDFVAGHLSAVRRESLSNTYYRFASFHFRRGNMMQARRYALAGWRQLRWRLHRTQLKVFVLGWGGRPGARLAERLQHTRVLKRA